MAGEDVSAGSWWVGAGPCFYARARAEANRMRWEQWEPALPMVTMSPNCPAANGVVDGERWPVDREPFPPEWSQSAEDVVEEPVG